VQRPGAHGEVEAVTDHVGVAVLQPHVEPQLGMALRDGGEQRHDDAPAVRDRQVDAQRSRRRGADAGGLGAQVLDLGEDALAPPEQPLAVGGEVDAARRAVKELDAETGLEAGDALGDRRRRRAEVARRRREAAAPRRLCEGDVLLDPTQIAASRIADKVSAMIRR
jgi:hypothetical protein